MTALIVALCCISALPVAHSEIKAYRKMRKLELICGFPKRVH